MGPPYPKIRHYTTSINCLPSQDWLANQKCKQNYETIFMFFLYLISKTIGPIDFLVRNFPQIIIFHHLPMWLHFLPTTDIILLWALSHPRWYYKTATTQRSRLQIEDVDKFANFFTKKWLRQKPLFQTTV